MSLHHSRSIGKMEKEDISAIDYKESSSPHPTETQDSPTPRAIKGLSDGQVRWLSEVSPKEADRIYHKVDKRLVPMLALLYLIAHLDRANIGNAKIEGLEKSLGMTGSDYNVALVIFFIPYILCEVPSNILLAKFKRPSVYIGILVICWGIIMTLSGVTKSFAGLLASRFFIGVFESGFFPGAMWLVSEWYPPRKTQTRMAMFYLASAASGAFSGLLAAGIAQMNGIGGYEGWRWIFILEGLFSVLVGISCFFLLPNSPASSKWLNADEIKFLQLSHIAFRGVKAVDTDSNGEKKPKKMINWPILKQVLTDWQLYLQSIVFWANTVPSYGLKFTMPTIIRNMGFKSTEAQLLTAPPYAFGAIASVTAALLADRLYWRMPFIVGSLTIVVVAFSVLFSFAAEIKTHVALCYTMVCLVCVGLYPIIPGNNSWTVNNLAGAEKRSAGIAFMIAVGNTGGIAGSFIYLERESPRYPTGFGSSLGFAAAGIVAALVLEALYWQHNKRYEHLTEEEAIAQYGEKELELMGNKSPLFKYSL